MIRFLCSALVVFFALTSQVYADEEPVYFRLINDNETLEFINYAPSIVPPMVQEIAMRTMMQRFSPESVANDYYQLKITRNIIWQGNTLVQYDYASLAEDRFRHVMWMSEDLSRIFKLEIYSAENKLMYAAICLGTNGAVLPEAKQFEELKSKRMYYGFANMHTEEGADGSYKMLFTDGMNRFSVFRSLSNKHETTEKLVIYGNNVYNTSSKKYRYTVVGGIPFERMEEITGLLIQEESKSSITAIRIDDTGNNRN